MLSRKLQNQGESSNKRLIQVFPDGTGFVPILGTYCLEKENPCKEMLYFAMKNCMYI